MNVDTVKEELVKIFGDDESVISNYTDRCLVNHGEDQLIVFDNYKNAQKYIDDSFHKYFSNNRHQLIHVYRQCFENDDWKNMVDWDGAFDHFKSRYEEIAGKNFKEENRTLMLNEIEKDFPSKLEAICDDESILSSFLYPFFNLNKFIEEVSDALEYRVYDYGQNFYVPKVNL